jgi:hypothetical protein
MAAVIFFTALYTMLPFNTARFVSPRCATAGETNALAHTKTARLAHVIAEAPMENGERNRLPKNVRVDSPVARQRSATDLVSAHEAATPTSAVLRKVEFPDIAAPCNPESMNGTDCRVGFASIEFGLG